LLFAEGVRGAAGSAGKGLRSRFQRVAWKRGWEATGIRFSREEVVELLYFYGKYKD
jgi:hypothetical protein